MKKHSMYAIFLFAVVALSYGFLSRESEEVNDISVLVKYKSQPGKEMIAVTELKSLVGKVKQEPHYGNITHLLTSIRFAPWQFQPPVIRWCIYWLRTTCSNNEGYA